jgi:hypothetical protein
MLKYDPVGELSPPSCVLRLENERQREREARKEEREKRE